MSTDSILAAQVDIIPQPGSGDTAPHPQHPQRFRDWSTIEYLCKFGNSGASTTKTFYNGDTVASRVGRVRTAITYIRHHWHDYSSLMDDLRWYIEELSPVPSALDTIDYLHRILSDTKFWDSADARDEQYTSNDFDVIRLYTSPAGYDQIFRIINQAFRSHSITDSNEEKRLRSAVFLIELLNIDLYNYTRRIPAVSNFQGTVYRGVSFTAEQLAEFQHLCERPVSERYWAIPLAMMSASTSRDVALHDFAGAGTGPNAQFPFLWRIHVVNLKPSYLDIYKSQFPTSIVSSICAVPIKGVSIIDAEDEVLLRGPFFQMVALREESMDGVSEKVNVMDLVMLNTNRDHPSTMELSERDGDRARKLFACLVGMWRAEVCMELASAYGLHDDVEGYRAILEGEKRTLDEYFAPSPAL